METREILTRRLSEADKKFAEDSLRSIVTFGFNLPKNGSYFVDGAVSVVSGSSLDTGYIIICPDLHGVGKSASSLSNSKSRKEIKKDSIYNDVKCVPAEQTVSITLDSVKSFDYKDGVGCVMLEYTDLDDCSHLLCRASMEYALLYSSVSKQLNRWLSVGKYDYKYESSVEKNCPKCGRPDKQGSNICLSCTSGKQYLGRLWKIAKPYRGYIYFSVLLYFFISGLGLLSPMLTRILTDDYIKADEMPRLSGYIITVFMIFAVSLISNIIGAIRNIVISKAGSRVIVDLRGMLFEKVESVSISNINRRTVGDIMSRITGDTGTLRSFIVNDLGKAVEMAVTFIGVCIFLFIYDPLIAVIVLLPMPVVYYLNSIFRKYVRKLYHRSWKVSSRARTIMHDIFSGIRVVKAYGREHYECGRYDRAINQEREATKRSEYTFSVFMPLLRFIMGIGEFFVIYYVGSHILDGTMTLGYMQQIVSYVSMIYAPLFWLSGLMRRLTNTLTSVIKIFEILDEESDIQERDNLISFPIEGNIKIDNVAFGYGNSASVLKNVSLEINKGEMVGIVGRSGAGKTTLINLILRLYDVEDGKITVDGVDLRDISQSSLRSQIGTVLQETFLFTGTVYENIAYSKPGAGLGEVITASKLAGAHDFIMRMPDGYNTLIGERGLTVSGGERQRISVARALLHNPRILILDEATSALDTETERQIQKSLAALTAGRTTIAIAHRLSTLRNATKLVVLDKGTVAEIGSHDELMRKKGIYYGLVMAQRQMGKISRRK